MNPADQRAHRTVTAQLEARIRALEQLVDLQARALAQFLPATADEFAALRLETSTLLAALQALVDHVNADRAWSGWQRWAWLLTGR
jgi:hypothetical protein